MPSNKTMSRHTSQPATQFFLAAFLIANATFAAAQAPLIERARPDAARKARSAAWLEDFGSQQPALLLTLVELERERNRWNSGPDGSGCGKARRAFGQVDRDELLRVADYRLVSAVGDALQALAGAVRACRKRRYFELDYRLSVARRSLNRAQELALAQARK